MRDHAHTLSDFRVPTLSIECEPCGRAGRYNVARLMERHGDAKLAELLYVLADCPKAKVQRRCDRPPAERQDDPRFRQIDHAPEHVGKPPGDDCLFRGGPGPRPNRTWRASVRPGPASAPSDGEGRRRSWSLVARLA